MRSFTTTTLAALAILAPLAQAQPVPPISQDLPIITMHVSGHSGFNTARTAVIDDMASLRAFFANSNVDLGPQPRVDFSTEQVLVAAMGTQPTGGYGIEITKVTLMTGGFTGGHAFVEVTETVPAPGQIVTMALTSPIHVVRVPRGAIAYHFNTVRPTAGFETVELSLDDPFQGTSERLVLQASGQCQLLRSSPTARYAPIDSQATRDELRAVIDAFANADVATLPATIPDPRLFIVPPKTETITSTLPGGAVHSTAANEGFYGPWEARFVPLMRALRAISTRILTPSFDTITLDWFAGFSLYDESVSIGSDGSVVVSRTGRLTAYFSGMADPSLVQQLKDAVAAADLPSLPANIDDPVMVADIPQLRIVSSLNGVTSSTVVAEAGFYDIYDARLRPVADLVQQIGQQIVDTGRGTLTDVVRIDQGRLFVGMHRVYFWQEPLAPLIAAQVGRTVTISGLATTSATGPRLDVESMVGYARLSLYVRTQPRSGAPIQRVLPAGTKVEVVEVQGQWLKVQAGQVSGWASGYYVQLSR